MTHAAVKHKMCTSKKRYARYDDAIIGAIESSRKFGPMRPYPCPYCKGFHLTSKVRD